MFFRKDSDKLLHWIIYLAENKKVNRINYIPLLILLQAIGFQSSLRLLLVKIRLRVLYWPRGDDDQEFLFLSMVFILARAIMESSLPGR